MAQGSINNRRAKADLGLVYDFAIQNVVKIVAHYIVCKARILDIIGMSKIQDF